MKGTHLKGWFKPRSPLWLEKKRGAEKPGQLTLEAEMMDGNKETSRVFFWESTQPVTSIIVAIIGLCFQLRGL